MQIPPVRLVENDVGAKIVSDAFDEVIELRDPLAAFLDLLLSPLAKFLHGKRITGKCADSFHDLFGIIHCCNIVLHLLNRMNQIGAVSKVCLPLDLESLNSILVALLLRDLRIKHQRLNQLRKRTASEADAVGDQCEMKHGERSIRSGVRN